MSAPTPAPARQAGFTLVEMLVAMAILAVVVGIGATSLARRDAVASPMAEAQRLAATLGTARRDAIRTGRETAVMIDAAAAAFAYPSDAMLDRLAPGTVLRITAARELSDAARTQILFRPDGSSSGGTVNLAAAGRPAAAVEINWLTGLVRTTTAASP